MTPSQWRYANPSEGAGSLKTARGTFVQGPSGIWAGPSRSRARRSCRTSLTGRSTRLLILLSFAPYVVALVVLYRRDRLRFEVKVIASIAVLCAFTTAPLFYLTIDWGRWIQMQIICLLLVILQAAQRAPGFQKTSNAPPFGAGKSWRPALLVAAFLYCTCWTLPVLGMQEVRFGYGELPLYFHREFRLMRNIHAWQVIDRGW